MLKNKKKSFSFYTLLTYLLKMKFNGTKKFFIRTWQGLSKGWSAPSLPEHILGLQSKPIIRIFRVLGGISTLALLGRGYLGRFELNGYVLYATLFIAFLFLLYNLYIGWNRINYISKNIKELEVRNSPLDTYATLMARLILCTKGFCELGPYVGASFGLILGVDQLLKDSGREAFFGPRIGSGLNSVLPPKINSYNWSQELQRRLSVVDGKEKDIKIINETINKINGFENLRSRDTEEISAALDAILKATNKELEESRGEVKELLDNPLK